MQIGALYSDARLAGRIPPGSRAGMGQVAALAQFLALRRSNGNPYFHRLCRGERRYSLGVLRAEWGTIWRSTIVGLGLLGASGATINKLHHAVAGGQRLSRAINSAEFVLQWRRMTAFVLLLLWPAAIGIAWLHFIWRTPADQGRLIFPAFLPLGLE
ncbi:MAG: hypothetical protein KDD78_12870 [Caldilineaceae bacterium]|nr:hypothetical protein [Caldilineaceae bacterium]